MVSQPPKINFLIFLCFVRSFKLSYTLEDVALFSWTSAFLEVAVAATSSNKSTSATKRHCCLFFCTFHASAAKIHIS